MPFYKIRVKQGHCGSGQSMPITFAFEAIDLFDAMEKAKNMPSVKHNKNDVIERVELITEAEYIEFRKVSAYKRRGIN